LSQQRKQEEPIRPDIADPELNPELFEHHKFVVDKGQEIMRIDKFLMNRLPNISRTKLQEAAKKGYVKADGVVIKSNYKAKPNEVITLSYPYPVRETELVAENIPLDFVYEDDYLAVINKPMGMVVHPGYGNFDGTLANALLYHFDNLPKRDDFEGRPGIVHRLDKNTTGLMVVAKTEKALVELSKQFFDKTTERKYWALVWGDLEEEEGRVEGHIGRSIKNRKLMSVFEDGEFGKEAVTNYKVLKRFGYTTLVQCQLETGRTHQIRAHMKHIGHTLFNDFDYGGEVVLKGTTFTKYKQFVHNCFKLLPRQALHAKTLGFTHPYTGEFMQFTSELPDDMQQVLDKWEGYAKNSIDFQ
jgi:23S rRNA pseudouridine1911/1915/1917 synthase